jgi:hypothetical protein
MPHYTKSVARLLHNLNILLPKWKEKQMTEEQRNATGVLYRELVRIAKAGQNCPGYTWLGWITYEEAGKITGISTRQSSKIMYIIEEYFCALRNLPRLNYLLVLKRNSESGTGRNPCRTDIPIKKHGARCMPTGTGRKNLFFKDVKNEKIVSFYICCAFNAGILVLRLYRGRLSASRGEL